MPKHKNGGNCERCTEMMNEFGVEPVLRNWFKILSAKVQDAHISCAGRNEDTQDAVYKAKKSRAKWGESPHNRTPSLAIDLFRLVGGKAEFEMEWYQKAIVPEMPHSVTWGGYFKKFPDGPHFEVTGWKNKPNVLIWRKDAIKLA